jgi:hypothetical protein
VYEVAWLTEVQVTKIFFSTFVTAVAVGVAGVDSVAAAIARLKVWDAVAPFASVTVRVTELEVAFAVGVPEITPVPVFKVRPAGRLPEPIDQTNVERPPDWFGVKVNELPTVPAWSLIVESVSAADTWIVTFVVKVTGVVVPRRYR